MRSLGRVSWIAAVTVAVLVRCDALAAQVIRGRVVDATDLRPIAAAEVSVRDGRGFVRRTPTDSAGRFVARVPEAGEYWVSASALGYHPADSSLVEVEASWQQVEVLVRLSAAPIELEGLTVLARGLELRHRATFEGFLERRKDALAVGTSRVVSSEDPQMKSAGNVRGVLDWFNVNDRYCMVVYLDGEVLSGFIDVGSLSVSGLAGVEFYRNALDAPLDFRGPERPCQRAARHSVLVLWRTRPGGSGGGRRQIGPAGPPFPGPRGRPVAGSGVSSPPRPPGPGSGPARSARRAPGRSR